jgi:hydrogenase expression/formation protein HypC
MCLAIPGKIVSIDSDDPVVRRGRVEFGGVIREVSLACVPEAVVGDYVLVHAGFALNVVDEEQARLTLEFLQTAYESSESSPDET